MSKVIGDYTAAVSIDGSTHYFLIQPGNSSTQYKKINRNTIMGVTGQPADISSSQTFTNKVLTLPTMTILDNALTIQDNVDPTKQAQFQLSSITTATTRTYTLPNASGTLADLATSQTFTNKTLTSPVITGGTITGSTVTTDAIVGQSAATSGTIYGMAITAAKVGTNGVVTNSITASAVDYTKVATGFAVQQVSTLSSAVSTGTTLIPVDDTIPQITEGTEFMTVSITPKSATNILVISIVTNLSHTIATVNLVTALFQDATANALAVGDMVSGASTSMMMMPLMYTMTAGTTSSTTFRVRAGSGTAGTLTFNGSGGARFFGAITKSSIVITEYKA